jgi:hypothetical protein
LAFITGEEQDLLIALETGPAMFDSIVPLLAALRKAH